MITTYKLVADASNGVLGNDGKGPGPDYQQSALHSSAATGRSGHYLLVATTQTNGSFILAKVIEDQREVA